MLTKNNLLLIYLIKIIQIIPLLTTNINENIKCRKAGDLFIQDLIQYECSINNGLNSNNIQQGCVPSNKTDGTVIRPGIAHISQHFRYECTNDSPNGISLKVTHCIDNEGKLVKIGEFFTQTTPENSEGKFTSVECVGNEFLAK
uniref:C6 domain-containing protein n=1 Tax=Meloidogyne floridensis TaxID=298350 RepID=A0A915PGA7_9BILA